MWTEPPEQAGAAPIPLLAEDVPAARLAVGDRLLLANGEYPIRGIDRPAGAVRVRLARLGNGVIEEDFGAMTFSPDTTVRRVRR